MIQTWVFAMHASAVCRHTRPRIMYGPMFVRNRERMNSMNYIYNNGDIEAVNMLRMKRAAFNQLVSTLRSRHLLRDSIHTCIEEQVAMFLHVVGHNQRFRVIHNTWRRSTETVSRFFKEVMYAIGELIGEMFKPASSSTPNKIAESHRWFPYFKVSKALAK